MTKSKIYFFYKRDANGNFRYISGETKTEITKKAKRAKVPTIEIRTAKVVHLHRRKLESA